MVRYLYLAVFVVVFGSSVLADNPVKIALPAALLGAVHDIGSSIDDLKKANPKPNAALREVLNKLERARVNMLEPVGPMLRVAINKARPNTIPARGSIIAAGLYRKGQKKIAGVVFIFRQGNRSICTVNIFYSVDKAGRAKDIVPEIRLHKKPAVRNDF